MQSLMHLKCIVMNLWNRVSYLVLIFELMILNKACCWLKVIHKWSHSSKNKNTKPSNHKTRSKNSISFVFFLILVVKTHEQSSHIILIINIIISARRGPLLNLGLPERFSGCPVGRDVYPFESLTKLSLMISCRIWQPADKRECVINSID